MFGYLTAELGSLEAEERARYQGCYCGLCRAIGRQSGQVCRLCLTYDMVFLTLLLGSLYEPEERREVFACPRHPFGGRESWRSPASDYAGDLNVLLARLNCLDDWEDDRRILRWGEARVLKRSADAAAERNPRQHAAIREGMALLRDIEQRRDPSPDAGANAFGALMGELFIWKEDRWSPLLRRLGSALGRFIYLLDAWVDRETDERRGSYNPLAALIADGATPEDLGEILMAQAADAADAWERLPLLRDASLQRKILYRGIWARLPQPKEETT